MALLAANREARVNAAMVRHHANAEGTLDGAPVVGIFDDQFTRAEVGVAGMAAAEITFSLPLLDAVDPVDKLLVLGAVTYRVVEARPDGDGWVTLHLEAAA